MTIYNQQPNQPSSQCQPLRYALNGQLHGQTSVFPEYLTMLLCVHAVFSCAARLMIIDSHPFVLAGIGASIWSGLRSVPVLKWRRSFPLVTIACMLLLIFAEFVPDRTSLPMIGGGPFSAIAVLSLLSLVLLNDLLKLRSDLKQSVRLSQLRERAHALIMKHGLRILLWGTTAVLIVWSVAVPLVQEFIHQQQTAATQSRFAMDRMTLSQSMLFKLSESMSGMWFFVVGSCVGSFLNVVIYRVPAGISVLAKASHCPVCQTKIASRDNLPLIGWLKLKGQCRSCSTSISARYPSVELTIGLLFLLLYFVELISGGTNLPRRTPNHYAGVLWILFYTKWDLLGLYLFHCFVLCAVFSWTMMQRDGHRVPTKAAVITIGLAISAALIWPHLLPWTDGGVVAKTMNGTAMTPLMFTLDRVISGAIVASSAGWLVSRLCGLPLQTTTWLLIGVAFGWQAAAGIGVLCVAVKLVILLATMLPADHDNMTAGQPGFPLGQPDFTRGQAGFAAALPSAALPAKAQWLWLLPSVLLVHHCLWRQLAAIVGGAL